MLPGSGDAIVPSSADHLCVTRNGNTADTTAHARQHNIGNPSKATKICCKTPEMVLDSVVGAQHCLVDACSKPSYGVQDLAKLVTSTQGAVHFTP